MRKVYYLLIIALAYFLFSCKTIDKPEESNVKFDTPTNAYMILDKTYDFKLIENGSGLVIAFSSDGESEDLLPVVNGVVKYKHKSYVAFLVCKKYNPSIGDFGKSDTLYYNSISSKFVNDAELFSYFSLSEDDLFMNEKTSFPSNNKSYLIKRDFTTFNPDTILENDYYVNQSILNNISVLSDDLENIVSYYQPSNVISQNSFTKKYATIYNLEKDKLTSVDLFNYIYISPDHKYLYSYNLNQKIVLYDIKNNKTIQTRLESKNSMVLGSIENRESYPSYVYYEKPFFKFDAKGYFGSTYLSQSASPTNLIMSSNSEYVYYISNGSIYAMTIKLDYTKAFKLLYTGTASKMSLNISNTKLLFFDKLWKVLDLKSGITTSLSVTSSSGNITW